MSSLVPCVAPCFMKKKKSFLDGFCTTFGLISEPGSNQTSMTLVIDYKTFFVNRRWCQKTPKREATILPKTHRKLFRLVDKFRGASLVRSGRARSSKMSTWCLRNAHFHKITLVNLVKSLNGKCSEQGCRFFQNVIKNYTQRMHV